MDGVHDLGGKQGFGPIEVDEPEEAFHSDWEARMWAIVRSTGAPDWTLDWWRHVRELIDPVDYLTRPYFDAWGQTQLAAFVNSGVFTLEEAITGRAAAPADHAKPEVLSRTDVLARSGSLATRYDRPVDTPPAYRVGERVRAVAHRAPHHSRLPAYASGRPCRIHAHHGAHVFADASAQGRKEAQHLYTVVFEARDLWPEAGERADRVFVDLWESYLEPA